MKIVNFSESPSLITHYLTELRDENIQGDRLRFRANLERLSFCMAYEISKVLDYKKVEINSPLAKTTGQQLKEKPVIAFVLRAGLAMQTGFLNAFDQADHCFISAYREEGSADDIKVHLEYLASPDLNGRTVIMVDPMLATGQSMVGGYKAMLKNGKPARVHMACIVAAPQGVNYIKHHVPELNTLWLGAMDEDLNDKAYIVPGLGDAGDLAFGEKL